MKWHFILWGQHRMAREAVKRASSGIWDPRTWSAGCWDPCVVWEPLLALAFLVSRSFPRTWSGMSDSAWDYIHLKSPSLSKSSGPVRQTAKTKLYEFPWVSRTVTSSCPSASHSPLSWDTLAVSGTPYREKGKPEATARNCIFYLRPKGRDNLVAEPWKGTGLTYLTAGWQVIWRVPCLDPKFYTKGTHLNFRISVHSPWNLGWEELSLVKVRLPHLLVLTPPWYLTSSLTSLLSMGQSFFTDYIWTLFTWFENHPSDASWSPTKHYIYKYLYISIFINSYKRYCTCLIH